MASSAGAAASIEEVELVDEFPVEQFEELVATLHVLSTKQWREARSQGTAALTTLVNARTNTGLLTPELLHHVPASVIEAMHTKLAHEHGRLFAALQQAQEKLLDVHAEQRKVCGQLASIIAAGPYLPTRRAAVHSSMSLEQLDRTLGELLQMFGSEVTVKQVITQQVQSLKNHQQVTTHVAAWNADAYVDSGRLSELFFKLGVAPKQA